MDRRELFASALAAGTLSAHQRTVRATQVSGDSPSHVDSIGDSTPSIVDTNVSLFRWPFRRLPLDETPKLVHKLRTLGIGFAWAGSFEAILHRDLAAVNARLLDTCEKYSELVPVGHVNLSAHGWQLEARKCLAEQAFIGVRLHPNYHGYTLESPEFEHLLEMTEDRGCLLQIATSMEDIRTQHPRLQTADVDLRPLPQLLTKYGRARVQLLNCRPANSQIEIWKDVPNLYLDTARVEGTDRIASLLRALPECRVLYGSHAPFLVPEAALIRVRESRLSASDLNQVLRSTALKLSESILAKQAHLP